MALEIWEYPITSFVPEQKEDDIVSLSEDNGVATNRDIQYFIFREERQDVSTWSDMMWEMANKFLAMNPAILYQEAAGNKNVWFATTAVSKNYRKLADGLYYCPTSSSTWNKMSILKNLFRLYGIDEDDLSFGLMPKKEDNREMSVGENGDTPARYEMRKQFWAEFIQYCEEKNGLFVKISPVTSNWISKSLKTPYGINVNAVVGFDYNRVEIYIDTKDKDFNKKLFDYLYFQKDAIEAEYGSALIWERMSEKRACRIKDEISCHTFEMDDKIEVFEFMRSSADKMYSIFHKTVLEYAGK